MKSSEEDPSQETRGSDPLPPPCEGPALETIAWRGWNKVLLGFLRSPKGPVLWGRRQNSVNGSFPHPDVWELLLDLIWLLKRKKYDPLAFNHCGIVNDCKLDLLDVEILLTEPSPLTNWYFSPRSETYCSNCKVWPDFRNIKTWKSMPRNGGNTVIKLEFISKICSLWSSLEFALRSH